MCIGIPMQVQSTRPGFAVVQGRGERKTVNTALIGEPLAGDWLLIFIDSAREIISPERAAEVNATLDLVAAAMSGVAHPAWPVDAAFDLPSAMSAEHILTMTAALAGQRSKTSEQETP
ncbi:MAG: HypC/HybG/HupF family hydrogenase formation chaperone [Vitreoscilla sp.]|nr:HypC/HybG/HupF family hydrogenase formation chaperone [Vitreoscilla sp.]